MNGCMVIWKNGWLGDRWKFGKHAGCIDGQWMAEWIAGGMNGRIMYG